MPTHNGKLLLSLSTTPILLLAIGCGGGMSQAVSTTTVTPTPVASPTPADSIYVFQDNDAFSPPQPSSILRFPKASVGPATPASTITGPANVIFQALAEDASGNLYVGANTYNASPNTGPGGVDLLVYALGSAGTSAPTRTIAGSATGLQNLSSNPIASLDVDSAGNLFVAADVVVGPNGPGGRIVDGISVFSPSANGNVPPSRVIAGDQTAMSGAIPQIAVTPAGGVYVGVNAYQTPGSILFFPPTATGNIAPTTVLGGPLTTIVNISGVAIDSAGNIYVASTTLPTTNDIHTEVPSILVFAAGSTGNVAPTRTISGSAADFGFIHNLRVDSTGNIYVLSGSEILKFTSSANGNVAPASAITSAAYFEPIGSLALQ
ncbi:SBBP repeat-containing protein [Granulicella sibirica]|uniref:Uncharacterized protein n=1 Tax=Granulicella sibirica TaxID=2479048 RepID=A0A4Q0T3X2_9BACT|nr:SBBP repeat-containing protein [Granulicella sibirica]RXH57612.1 hypothetical protein GRAN_0922 [Granulicella sibirica]